MRTSNKWFITSYGGNKERFYDWVQRDQFNLLYEFKERFLILAEAFSQHMIDNTEAASGSHHNKE
jgi:hypothetical protein